MLCVSSKAIAIPSIFMTIALVITLSHLPGWKEVRRNRGYLAHQGRQERLTLPRKIHIK